MAGERLADMAIDLRLVADRGRQLGHVVDLETRGPWPELGDIHPKFYLTCSCGWKFKAVVRSQKNAMRWLVFHLGFEVGKHDGKAPANVSVSVPGMIEGIRESTAHVVIRASG